MSTGPTTVVRQRRVDAAGAGREPYLTVTDLNVAFPTADGLVRAVQDLSYSLALGRTLAIVGESGSGKSVSSMAIMGLHNRASTRMSGSIVLGGHEIVGMEPEEVRRHRGVAAAMIFQDPQSSLHPFFTVGNQIVEAYQAHHAVSTRVAKDRAVEMLGRVGIPSPRRRMDDYPHQFSGGMRQRVMIAMALINNPDLLVADEPTTALDVTTQAQILTLIEKLQSEFGSAVIMITHDLGVVAEIADDVVVMYAAEVAEKGTVGQIFKQPHHPYTWGLMGSLPRLDAHVERLVQIQGQPPSLLRPPSGCRFHPRCPYVMNICKTADPALAPVSDDPTHLQACHLDEETKNREAAKLLASMMAEAS